MTTNDIKPVKVYMDDGTEVTLIRRDGCATIGKGPVYFSIWQASTKWNTTGFGATEQDAIASLYERLEQ